MSEKRVWKVEKRTDDQVMLELAKQQEQSTPRIAVRVDEKTIILVKVGSNASDRVKLFNERLNEFRKGNEK